MSNRFIDEFMKNYRPILSDERIEYLETYGTEEEINEAVELVISDMEDYFEYLIEIEEEKRIRRKCN